MSDNLVNWYGKKPLSWKLIKLKYTVTRRDEKASKESILPYVGLEDIISHKGKLQFPLSNNEDISGISNVFYSGDVLFGKLRPYLAKVCKINFSGRCTGELLVLSPSIDQIEGLFLKYLLLSQKFIDEVNSTTYGSKMPRANWREIGNIKIPLPTNFIQKNIENFLDKKTSEIDTLIEDKEKLIEILEEKRQAIITEAVTKGLNPDAKMKDSGVEWIGEIPEYWNLKKIKRVFETTNGYGFPENLQGERRGDVPFVKVSDFPKDNEYISSSSNYISNNTLIQKKWSTVEPMSIITAKIGEAMKKNHRKVNLVPCLIDNNMMSLRVKEGILKYYFYASKVIDFAWFENPGAIPSLNHRHFRESYIVFPPINEQKEIASLLDLRTQELEDLIMENKRVIGKLKEYRQALIYEAVTGKIDVQEMVKETEQEEVSSS